MRQTLSTALAEQTQVFFVVTPPGLEELAAQELNLKAPGLPPLAIEKGGFEVSCPFSLGLSLNQVLRIPSSILLRIADFKCRDLPKLYQKVSNIKWGMYLINNDFELDVSSSKSRLLHEKKIEKTFREGIARHFSKQPPKKRAHRFSLLIKVRFYDDQCTVSIDTSGELLFKRGYKTLEGRAPIRENLASALFFAMQTSGLMGRTLIDPMCGTGTLLLESYLFWQKSSYRKFAYENHPDWLATPVALTDHLKIDHFVGIDTNAKSLQSFRDNIAALSMDSALATRFQLYCEDFFNTKSTVSLLKDMVFISNPPYDERLKLPTPPRLFYEQFLERMARYHPLGFGVVVPKKYQSNVPERQGLYITKNVLEFSNGGIPVQFKIYGRS